MSLRRTVECILYKMRRTSLMPWELCGMQWAEKPNGEMRLNWCRVSSM